MKFLVTYLPTIITVILAIFLGLYPKKKYYFTAAAIATLIALVVHLILVVVAVFAVKQITPLLLIVLTTLVNFAIGVIVAFVMTQVQKIGYVQKAIVPFVVKVVTWKTWRKVILLITAIAAAIFAVYPVWFIILASGRPSGRLLTFNLAGMFIPTAWSFANYQKMLFEEPFLIWMKNSLVVAAFTTIACLFIATSAAFAFSRMRFYGREWGLVLFLAIQSFPGVLSLIPIAQLLTAIGGYGKLWGLILAYTVGTLIFTTMNLKGYFDTIPIDLEEAAMIDGCGPVQSFLLIALPLARPAIAVTALFAFMGGWGEYVLASVLIPAPEVRKTAMVALYKLANDVAIPWGLFAAGAVMIIIPVLIVFLFLQRYLEGGLTLGGVKG